MVILFVLRHEGNVIRKIRKTEPLDVLDVQENGVRSLIVKGELQCLRKSFILKGELRRL